MKKDCVSHAVEVLLVSLFNLQLAFSRARLP